MGFREVWKKAGETIEEEIDERTELAASKALARVALVVVPLAVAFAVILLVFPLTGDQVRSGLALLVPTIVFVSAAILTLSMRRGRTVSDRFNRAVLVRSLWSWPVVAAVIGLVDWFWKGDLMEAATSAAAFIVAGLVFGPIYYLWLSRRG